MDTLQTWTEVLLAGLRNERLETISLDVQFFKPITQCQTVSLFNDSVNART